MEKTLRVKMFILLVTVSSVLGMDFAFTKDAYLEIKRYEENVLKSYHDYDVPIISFKNMDEGEDWVVDRSNQKLKDNGKSFGTFLLPKKRNNSRLPEIVVSKEGQVIHHERLANFTMVFTTLSRSPDSTVFGTLVLNFKENKDDPHETGFAAYMFSPPQNDNDKACADEVAVEANPLTDTNMKQIEKGKLFEWKLSFIKAALDEIKLLSKIDEKERKAQSPKFTLYLLKPIIVNRDLLFKYFLSAHPKGGCNKLADNVKQEGETSTSGK